MGLTCLLFLPLTRLHQSGFRCPKWLKQHYANLPGTVKILEKPGGTHESVNYSYDCLGKLPFKKIVFQRGEPTLICRNKMERQSRNSDHWRRLRWCESGLSSRQSGDERCGPPGKIRAHSWIYLARSKKSTSKPSQALNRVPGQSLFFPLRTPHFELCRASFLSVVLEGAITI